MQGIPGLVLPQVSADCQHNWYNYVLRFDLETLGFVGDAQSVRQKLIDALNAEGVQNGVWQRFILPAMTVFQAKNGYGKGCPWECAHARPVDYSLDQYPEAQRHCDTHTCISMALRSPNGTDVADLLAEGIRKVVENVDQII